ncbi:MAG: YggU family protein [Nitrospinae bacterium]|nr:YggU family protein [Nitrospinota bacterium]
MAFQIRKCKEGIQFAATIQPRSSRNEITGLHNDALKIRLTSPPVEGAANRLCVKFLAKALDVSPSRIAIVSGLSGRNKTIQIEAMDEKAFLEKLQAIVPDLKPGD